MIKTKSLPKILLTGLLTLCIGTSVALAAPILKLDSHGHDVLVLQKRLQELGYNIKTIDGVFGNEVYRAVIAFQRDNKIKISGVVDSKTWNALKNATPIKEPVPTIQETPAPAKPVQPAITTTAINTKKVPESQPFLEQSKVGSIIATAKKQIGVKYMSGGTTPKGFDCSGFLQYVFAQNGMSIPRLADEQYRLGKSIKQTQLVPGDLVFFNTDGTGISHCGIYVGNGEFIHASSSKGIRIDKLNDIYYWKDKYYGSKHIVK